MSSSPRAWATLPARTLLARHRASAHPLAAPTCVGDALLLRRNLVMRNVRATSTALGFRASSTLPYAYDHLELLALPAIYASKVIPYRDNLAPLEHLERERPGVFTCRDLVTIGLRPNTITHEAAHCVAKTLVDDALGADAVLPAPLAILGVQLAESFANSVECLGLLWLGGPLDEAAYNLNSYQSTDRPRDDLRALAGELGLAGAASVALAAHLCANFLWSDAPERMMRAAVAVLAPRVQLPVRLRGPLRAIFRRAFALNPIFRRHTTACFFKHAGLAAPVDELLDVDFLELAARDSRVAGLVARLAAIAARGPRALPA